jgi:heme-degrading monooxygenase HmoA
MYVILWEFVVQPDRVADFVAAYRTDGDWAKLFRLANGYLGTELLNAADDTARFLTIDRWRSAKDFARFKDQFHMQYRELDAHFEGLIIRETHLGSFTTEAGT